MQYGANAQLNDDYLMNMLCDVVGNEWVLNELRIQKDGRLWALPLWETVEQGGLANTL